MLQISFDIREFEREVDAAVDAIHDGASKGLDRAADVLLGHKRRKMQRTYSRAIPKGKNGKPKWSRTGAWLNGQEVEKTGPLERTVTTTGDAEAYERRLSNLRTGADGVNRTNNAAGDAQRVFEPQFLPIMEEAISGELRRRGQGK